MRTTKQVIGATLLAAVMGMAVTEAQAVSIVSNGSFEQPVVGGSFVTEPPGQPDDWDVLGPPSSIDQIGSLWQAADQFQSLDMNGFYYGVIGQKLALTAGQYYTLKFAMSGNPGGTLGIKSLQADLIPLDGPLIGASKPFAPTGPNVDGAAVSLTGVSTVDKEQVFYYDTATQLNTLSDMKWVYFTLCFKAGSADEYLQFTSRTVNPDPTYTQSTSSPYGPALDAVSIAVPLPAAAGVGFSTLGGFGMLAGLRKVLRHKARIA